MKKLVSIVFSLIIVSNICIAGSRILATVGDDIITTNDLEKRYAVLVKTNNLVPTSQEIKAIKLQLLHSLINEKIIIQEAKRLKINITDQDIEESIENIDRNQNLPKGSFFKHQEQYGISKEDLKEQIYVKLAWQKILVDVIFATYGQDSVSDTDLNEFIAHNHPTGIRIKGFIYQFNKENLRLLKKLYKAEKGNLCDIKKLKDITGVIPEKINSSLKDIKNPKIKQVASFAKEDPVILTTEKGNEVVVFILCEKKPTVSEKELNKIREELKDKKMQLYTEHYLKNLKKKKPIKINNIQ